MKLTPENVYATLEKAVADGVLPGWDGDKCQYRAPGGHKCAVGCCLTDEQAGDAGGWSIGTIKQLKPKLIKQITADGTSYIQWKRLQVAHDDACYSNSWSAPVFLADARRILGIKNDPKVAQGV